MKLSKRQKIYLAYLCAVGLTAFALFCLHVAYQEGGLLFALFFWIVVILPAIPITIFGHWGRWGYWNRYWSPWFEHLDKDLASKVYLFLVVPLSSFYLFTPLTKVLGFLKGMGTIVIAFPLYLIGYYFFIRLVKRIANKNEKNYER